MSVLIITRGLPGSGKTTWARNWVAQDPAHRVRVNRDDLRAMAHSQVHLRGSEDHVGTEQAIVAARDALITSLLRRKLDVVCDDTNLPQRTVRDLRVLARRAGAEFRVRDLTDVPVDVCVARDAARDRVVGEEVIRDLHHRFLRGRPHPLPLPDEVDPGRPEVYTPPVGAPSAVLVDVDGTVALMTGRSPYDETRVHEDQPNLPVIEVVRAMSGAGHRIVFVSARTEGCRTATEKWLSEQVGVPYERLLMRQVGDMRRDSIVKREIFDAYIRDDYRVVCVLDDRRQVVQMWRALGLTVLQVAEGDF